MKPSAIRIERMLAKAEAALVPPPRRCLQVIIHEGDDEAAAKEKALAEHIGAHPEDAGRTVKDFNWVVNEIVHHLTIGADGRWLGDTDGGEFEDTDLSEGEFEDTDKDTDGPSEPIDLPPPDPGCARSKPWRPVHQRPARDQRRPTWKKWER